MIYKSYRYGAIILDKILEKQNIAFWWIIYKFLFYDFYMGA